MNQQKLGRENQKAIRLQNNSCEPNNSSKKAESLSPSQKQRIVKSNNIQQTIVNQSLQQPSQDKHVQSQIQHQQQYQPYLQINPQQQQIQFQAPPPKEEKVFDFKREIERRFEKSQVNKNYQFPRYTRDTLDHNTNDNDSQSSDDDSFESMKGVTVYNLRTQNLHAIQKSALNIKLSEFPTEAIYLKTEGDEPLQHQKQNKTQNNFRKAQVIKQAIQQQQQDNISTQINLQQDYNTLSSNLQASIRISMKKVKPNQNINGRHIRYESEYQPGRNQQNNAQNLSINNNKMLQTNSFVQQNAKGQKNKGQNFMMLLKTENLQNVYKNAQIQKKIQPYIPNPLQASQQQQFSSSEMRVLTEGADPVLQNNYEQLKQNNLNQNNIGFNNNSNNNPLLLIKPNNNNVYVKYKANNNFHIQTAQKNYNNILSKSFHFKSTNKSKERDQSLNNKVENILIQNGSDRLSTLQSVDAKINQINENSSINSELKKTKRINQVHGQSSEPRDKFDLDAYLVKTKKKQQ